MYRRWSVNARGERHVAGAQRRIGQHPVLSGALLQGPLLGIGLPFLVAGGLKAVYDLTLWGVFRRVRLPEEK